MCLRKSQEAYSFRKTCLFIEDSLRPFQTPDIKIDLNEVHHHIIKSEDVDVGVDKYVCRLCMQCINSGITLSADENDQIEKILPEIVGIKIILLNSSYSTLYPFF